MKLLLLAAAVAFVAAKDATVAPVQPPKPEAKVAPVAPAQPLAPVKPIGLPKPLILPQLEEPLDRLKKELFYTVLRNLHTNPKFSEIVRGQGSVDEKLASIKELGFDKLSTVFADVQEHLKKHLITLTEAHAKLSEQAKKVIVLREHIGAEQKEIETTFKALSDADKENLRILGRPVFAAFAPQFNRPQILPAGLQNKAFHQPLLRAQESLKKIAHRPVAFDAKPLARPAPEHFVSGVVLPKDFPKKLVAAVEGSTAAPVAAPADAATSVAPVAPEATTAAAVAPAVAEVAATPAVPAAPAAPEAPAAPAAPAA